MSLLTMNGPGLHDSQCSLRLANKTRCLPDLGCPPDGKCPE